MCVCALGTPNPQTPPPIFSLRPPRPSTLSLSALPTAYPTIVPDSRYTAAMASMSPMDTSAALSGSPSHGGSVSSHQAATPKNVAFELMFSNSPQNRARLPMRVQIYPHDTTDSIVTTVKNFYGLYSGPTGSKGVSFEDDGGNTLIARYENFRNNMIVYVRIIDEPPAAFAPHAFHPAASGPNPYYATDACQARQPQRFDQDIHRPASRASRRRSRSPMAGRGRRSVSASTAGKKRRSRSAKNRASAAHSPTDAYSDSINGGYSSGDGATSTTSGKTKEQLGNTTDISVDNIVEGGRRKRAKFESSVGQPHLMPSRRDKGQKGHGSKDPCLPPPQELPLFAPPQMPAATSNPSVSPARRIEHQRPLLPFVHPGHTPFTNAHPTHSPQGFTADIVHCGVFAAPAPQGHRSRGSFGYASNGSGLANALGVLPTPDPTVGSCVSEEDKDVAIQLMRLGESSNISHGRTSASTMDDTFSGRADAASSIGATSDCESDSDHGPAPFRQQMKSAGAMGARRIYETTEAHFMPTTESADISGDEADFEDGTNSSVGNIEPLPAGKKASAKHHKLPSVTKPSAAKHKPARLPGVKAKKQSMAAAGPMSPASLMTHSRKHSVASASYMARTGEEEDQPDLSTKPRCQRCRKSKKGCDRQRPCGRCRDAGLSADQCISEDEGNGRKGRYGRHMGVPIKREDAVSAHSSQPTLLPAAPISTAAAGADKAKKRKR